MIASSRKKRAVPAKNNNKFKEKNKHFQVSSFDFLSDFQAFKHIWITFQIFSLSVMTKKLVT